MASRVFDIADAIVTLLNGGSYGVSFTAERRYFGVEQVKSLAAGNTVVAVRPVTLEEETGTRAGTWERLGFQILIVRRVDASDHAAVDALVDLELDIRAALEAEDRIGGATVDELGLGAGSGELYDGEMLLAHRTFMASVDITLTDR